MGIDLNKKECIFACYNYDEEIRKESSSGGFFSIIAEWVIDQNGIVYGAAFDSDFSLYHIGVDRKDELYKLRGSKYVQSNIGNSFGEAKKALKTGRKVLFTGTPCQISALKKFLMRDYDNLITVDVICHGTPSPMVWKKYLDEMCQNQTIKRIDFRDKDTGWKKYSIKIESEENVYSDIFSNDYYMKAFLDNYSLRPSCYQCITKGDKVSSDITIGDYWGVEQLEKEIDDDKGLSVLLANTDVGIEIVNHLKERMFLKNVVGTEICQFNPCLIKSVDMPRNREKFFRCVIAGRSVRDSYLYCKKGPMLKRILRKGKNLVKKEIKKWKK